MADEPSGFDPSNSSTSSGPDRVEPADWEQEFSDSSTAPSSASFAVDIARIWVKEHQKASMLGAFAVGVFVGALLRE